MRRFLSLVTAAALFVPVGAVAQSVFDGTWKLELKGGDASGKPFTMVLQNGTYECTSCAYPYKVQADGKDHPISGNPYVDTAAVDVLNDHETKETDKKDGKVVMVSHATVAPDGNSVSVTFTDSSNTNGGPPVAGGFTSQRAAKGPQGSHLISGSWKVTTLSDLSDNGRTWTYKVSGDELVMTSPTGQSFTAKLDGTEAPMKGDPGISSVSVRLISANTLEETDKLNGKVINVTTTTVNADGKSAKLRSEDKVSGRTGEFSALKQ